MNLHDLLKIYKHGYSKITDHLTREIRYGRIDRRTGLKIIKKLELKKPERVNLFCDWIGIDKDSLSFVLDKHRNSKFWKQVDVDKWIFNGWSKQIKVTEKNKKIKKINFISNSSIKRDKLYHTIAKGWPL
jgi:hypothetical protein